MAFKLAVGFAVLALALWLTLFGLDSEQVGSVDGPVLTLPEVDSAMAAEISGVLTFDAESGCLLLQSGLGLYPLVWPAGTSWVKDPPAVELTPGRLAAPGVALAAGGGYLDREGVKSMAGANIAGRAAACAGPTGEIAVVQTNIMISTVTDLVD